MVYILSGVIIFGTHFMLKENQQLIHWKLWQLLFGAIFVESVAVLLSTWLSTLLPVIIMTLISATTLQVKFSQQIVR